MCDGPIFDLRFCAAQDCVVEDVVTNQWSSVCLTTDYFFVIISHQSLNVLPHNILGPGHGQGLWAFHPAQFSQALQYSQYFEFALFRILEMILRLAISRLRP